MHCNNAKKKIFVIQLRRFHISLNENKNRLKTIQKMHYDPLCSNIKNLDFTRAMSDVTWQCNGGKGKRLEDTAGPLENMTI